MISNDEHIGSKYKHRKCPNGAQDKAAENMSQSILIHSKTKTSFPPAVGQVNSCFRHVGQ